MKMDNLKIKLMRQLKKDFASMDKVTSSFQLYSTLPDPDKILEDNNYDYAILRDLLNDPHLTAVVQQRKSLVAQLGWEISCEGDKEAEKRVVRWMQEIDIERIISKMIDACLYGFVVFEINWKTRSNEIIPKEINAKPQEWFIFSKERELKLREKDSSGYVFKEGIELPKNKFIVLQNNPDYTNPYGEKLLSKCYWPINLKRSGLDFWQIMVERYGMPFLIGRYAVGATPAEKAMLLEGIQDLVTDNIAVFQEGVEIELKEHPKFDIGQLYQYLAEFYNAEISKVILTETLTTEIKGVGSYAAAQVHRETAATVAMGDKKLVEKGINELIKIYSSLNYAKEKVIRFRLTKKEDVEQENIERDLSLEKMGIKFSKEYYQRKYNLNADDFEIGK